MSKTKVDEIVGDYKYGFTTDAKTVLTSGKGLSREVVEFISNAKKEPSWMKEFRLNSYDAFLNLKNPSWGPDLSGIDFNEYTYYIKSSEKTEHKWEDVPEEIKETFDKLGIPEAEAKYLAGSSTQFESEVVYHNNLKELDELGVIFCDTDTALREHADLMQKYFGKLVPYTDNKYAALNSAVWSGGSFIYVPKGVKLKKPVQSYFRINSERMGQFERTLIIVDDDADIHYVEGCTAPQYSKDSLHAAVVEIFVGKRAHCRYSTVQNWSNNIVNLVTKRAIVDDEGHMEWIDGNVGAGLNMKYPACVLKGNSSKGTTVSIAFAAENQIQDTGAKMIHLGPNSSSTIISKSICRGGGKVNYRGTASCGPKALGARSHIECDTLILDEISTSDTIPTNSGKNSDLLLYTSPSPRDV
ncbi:MAG: Fe-S cluster assembly protein SufB, partial [Anaeroplasmataceae bacterium]|nr:Fe-S cluster assembly protein SufB [Anaeroplasmataceae bacterium]